MKEPRSGDVQIAGTPWLARMIDKSRLEAAGEIEQFDLEFPCPMDRSLLSRMGVDAKAFQQITIASTNDEQIVDELKKIGAKIPA